MSDRRKRESAAVDRLVRGHLDRLASRADASALVARILASRPGVAGRPGVPPRGWSRPIGWASAAAAVVLAAFLGGRLLGPPAANADALLRGVRDVHARAIDRCYRVHFVPDPRSWDGSKVLDGPSESVLWTRGDRFWASCSVGPIRLKLGRSEDGTLWASPSPSQGIRFADGGARLPEEVAVLCDLNAMTVPTLVDDVLAGFDLRAEGPRPDDPEASIVIWARPKPGRSHPLIASALLEIDAGSDTLRGLVLWLLRDGAPRGTVTYTLIASAERADGPYRLEAHLGPGAEIETHRIGGDDPAGAPGEPDRPGDHRTGRE